VALVGGANLVVEHVLPRLLVAAEQAQGAGIFDPQLGGDPMLVRPHHLARTLVSLLLLFTGTAHAGAAMLYRRATKGTLIVLVVLGALSLVPTSVAFAVFVLVALNRPANRASGQDANPSTPEVGSS
jgi:hypothetical protein